ncbi:MAG: sulfotransferase [Sandaracinaceae bacterium]
MDYESLGLEGRIFIAGTGRSGTTRLSYLMGQHPDVWLVPTESRFIIDPDGLEDLVRALSDGYTFYHADQALKRFDHLMRQTLTGNTETAFKGWHLDKRIGHERWYRHLNAFVEPLIGIDFEEDVPVDIFSDGRGVHWPSQQKKHRRTIGKYFADRGELVAHCRQLIDGLFAESALEQGRPFWCEKTPLNLLSLDFLWELYPDAKIVHITRDPRGVAHSLRKQWSYESIDMAIDMLLPYYDRWQKYLATHDLSDKPYLEVKVETLAADPTNQMALIQRFCGLRLGEYPADSFSTERNDSWMTQMSLEERARIEDRLGPYFEVMGYSVEIPEEAPAASASPAPAAP